MTTTAEGYRKAVAMIGFRMGPHIPSKHATKPFKSERHGKRRKREIALLKSRASSEHHQAIEKMTNWQRTQYSKALAAMRVMGDKSNLDPMPFLRARKAS